MNESYNDTRARYARASTRHARHLHHLHRLHQDVGCGGRRERGFGHARRPAGTGRPGGFAMRGHHDPSGRGGNRRAVYGLHRALAGVARSGDEQLRDEAARIVTEATERLNGLLAADR